MQHEILSSRPLLTESGALSEPGFARRPLLRYNPERIALTPLSCLNRLRLKEWDFYATTTREISLSFAVAHAGVVGVVGAQVLDLREGAVRERSIVTLLGRGCALPRSSERGAVRFRRGAVEVSVVLREGRRDLRVRWPQFDGAAALEADLQAVEPSTLESMVIATPIGRRGFYYNRKTCCMPTTGRIALGALRLDLDPARAFTTLDWGRGVWPYRTFWIWASGSGRLPGGRTLGINLGGGFGDTGAATENCFFIDGKMTKLDGIDFDYDRADAAARPWRFRAPDGRLDLQLSNDLFAMRKRLEGGLIGSDLRQITGTFRGHVTSDAGERIEVGEADEVIGWAEEHRARW